MINIIRLSAPGKHPLARGALLAVTVTNASTNPVTVTVHTPTAENGIVLADLRVPANDTRELIFPLPLPLRDGVAANWSGSGVNVTLYVDVL
jgi:hypothetical protein